MQTKGIDLNWNRVYNYFPESHVRFEHAPHIRAKVECSNCHGNQAEQTVARRAVNMDMAFCVNCHKTKAGVERLPDLSLLIALMDRRTLHQAHRDHRHHRRADGVRQSREPDHPLHSGRRSGARRRDLEAEHLPALQRRLRRDRARHGRRRGSVPQRPGGRDSHGPRQEARRQSRGCDQPGQAVRARPGGDSDHVSPRSPRQAEQAHRASGAAASSSTSAGTRRSRN